MLRSAAWMFESRDVLSDWIVRVLTILIFALRMLWKSLSYGFLSSGLCETYLDDSVTFCRREVERASVAIPPDDKLVHIAPSRNVVDVADILEGNDLDSLARKVSVNRLCLRLIATLSFN